MVVAAVTAPGTRPRVDSSAPTAAPSAGPKAIFCGRTPSRPPTAPVAVAIGSAPAPRRSAAQPTGAGQCLGRGQAGRAGGGAEQGDSWTAVGGERRAGQGTDPGREADGAAPVGRVGGVGRAGDRPVRHGSQGNPRCGPGPWPVCRFRGNVAWPSPALTVLVPPVAAPEPARGGAPSAISRRKITAHPDNPAVDREMI